MIRYIGLVLSIVASLTAQRSITLTIPVHSVVHTIQSEKGYVRINAPAGRKFGVPGDPELPAFTFTYLIPYGTRVKDIDIQTNDWHEIATNIRIYPKQIDYPIYMTGAQKEWTEPVYERIQSYPQSPVVAWSNGSLRGYSCMQVSIVPYKYHPGSGKLLQLRSLEIECILEVYDPPVSPGIQSTRSDDITKRIVAACVNNHSAVSSPLYKPPCTINDRFHPQEPVGEPARSTAPVDLLIITDDLQYDAYYEYAQMSRLLGYNTVVRTLTWIRQRYSGVDDAERIRSFIRAAVNEWGVVYVLLGGDTPVIPTRWVHMEPLYDRWPVHIVSDLYYADLDGDWNFDRDSRFGEVTDSLDLFPDVFVGRLPTRTPGDVNLYAEKYQAYIFSPPHSALTRALFITSDFEVTNDAYNMAKRLAQHLPTCFDTVFLNERPLYEVVDSLNSGFGFVAGLGHGDNNNLRIRNNPRANIYNFNFDSLMNQYFCGIMPVITCFTNTIQTDCLGEHWILNSHGGGISYIGPTCCSEAYLHEEFTRTLLDSLYRMPVGAAQALSKVPFIAQAQWDNWYRLYEFCIIMLGDPTIQLWDSIPNQWTIVNVSKDTVVCGIDSIITYCSPMVPYYGVFVKDEELFLLDSTMTGIMQTVLNTETPGYIHYRLQSDGFIPYQGSLYVCPGEPRLYIDHYSISDSLGNNNGVLNPGDTIALWLHVKNSGGDIATKVSGRISCDDSDVIILNDTSMYPDIESNSVIGNNVPFMLWITDSVPDAYAFDIDLTINFQSTLSADFFSVEDSIQLVCASSVLEHFSQNVSASMSLDSIVYDISVEIRNTGHATAENIHACIRSLSDSIVIIDSSINIAQIPANRIVSSGADVFQVQRTDTATPIHYYYSLYEDNELINTTQIVIDTPDVPAFVTSIPCGNAIQIGWQPVSGICGYRIFRSNDPDSGYVLLTEDLIGVCHYEDFTAQSGQQYFYRVVAIDQWMNQGDLSNYSTGSLSPAHAPGWPQPVYDYLFSSCTIGDLDPFYPGYEIVVCGKDGRVYAWHYDGSPVCDQSVIFDISPTQVWTSPAIGDIDNEGTSEIVFGVRRSVDNLYVITRDGQCMYGWPITVPGQIIGSPVLADLDQNGDLEIIIWTVQADIYVFDHTGQGFFSPTGILKDLPGIAFGSVSVGDIDQDGNLEIVCAGGSSGDSLYVWDDQGQPETPFPIHIQSGGLTYSTVLGDICGDDRLEILFYADNSEGVYAVDADGVVLWFTMLDNVADIEGSPVIGDMTGDGHPEILCGYQTGFTILDSLGIMLTGFPDTVHDAKLVVVADVDNNGAGNAIVGSVDWNVYTYTSKNVQVPGFPIFLNNRIESSPGIYDIDNDGRLELMIGGNGLLFHVYDLHATEFDWPLFRYDQYNSGTYRSGNLLSLKSSDLNSESRSPRLTVSPTVFSDRLMVTIPAECMAKGGLEQKLTIYDICGRSVTTIRIPYRYPEVDVSWGGYDIRGEPVAAGVYFITFNSGERSYTTKVIKIK